MFTKKTGSVKQNRRQMPQASSTRRLAAIRRHTCSSTTTTTIKMVRTPVLDIGYEEHGDPNGVPIVLLHGFPYYVRSWDGVAPPLVKAGYRVLAPYLRGYGPTRFRDPNAPRTAEQAAIGQDVIDFADALRLERFALAGYDWGLRAGCITSILHPHRVLAFVAIGGYSVFRGPPAVQKASPAPAKLEAKLWYQWYFNLEQGRAALENEKNRHDVIRLLWEQWAPTWSYSADDYARSAPSFDNPDFVEVVLHSYRHRNFHPDAPGEERFLGVERRLADLPPVPVPTIVLHGRDTGLVKPSEDPARDQARFPAMVARRLVDGAGHDLPVQRPEAVSGALIELLAGKGLELP